MGDPPAIIRYNKDGHWPGPPAGIGGRPACIYGIKYDKGRDANAMDSDWWSFGGGGVVSSDQ